MPEPADQAGVEQPPWLGALVERLDALVAAAEAKPANVLPLTLKRQQAADLVGVSVQTWDRMTAGQENPEPIYIGRCPAWRVAELREWVVCGCPDRKAWQSMRRSRIADRVG